MNPHAVLLIPLRQHFALLDHTHYIGILLTYQDFGLVEKLDGGIEGREI